MSRTIWHIEIITQGDRENSDHGYYSSREGLYWDNQEIIPVSLETLKRYNWKKNAFRWVGGDKMIKVVIRKGAAYTTGEVRRYSEALENIEPEMFTKKDDK